MLGLSCTNPIGCYHINLMITILYGYLHICEFKYNLSEFRLFLLLVDVVEQIYFPLFRKSKLNKTKTHICMSGMFPLHLTQTQMVPRFVFEHPRNNSNIIID